MRTVTVMARVAFAAALAPLGALAAPFVPASGTEVIETLPAREPLAGAELQRQRAEWARAPRNPALAAGLAQRYIELGRAAGDPRYLGYAQAVLSPWWREPAPPAPVLLLRATLLQSSHRFADALRDLHAVTRADPGNPQAWLTLATVQVVRGEYDAAVRSCGKLSSLAIPLASMTCLANARAASGHLAASERLLALAVARSGESAPDNGLRLWALTLLGEMAARRGDAAGAEARYRQALALAPGDSHLLGAYADLLLDQHRNADVQRLLRGHQRVDSLLLRHTLAAPQTAAIAELRARFDAATRRGDAIHQREQARFELNLRHNARGALQLALANWEVQKEPADLRILLEAALAARSPEAARPALAWRRMNGLEDEFIAALARKLEGGPT
jgi:cytochrome c-type biogenesis protein CcmH/NrfG